MSSLRAVVTGMIATYPVGGVAWDYAQYVLALERLGVEVWYLEDTGWETYDPRTGTYGEDPSYGVGFLAGALRSLSPTLGERWHVRGMDGTGHGIPVDEAEALVADADLLLNVSGGTLLRQAYLACKRKVLVDTDPGWNHFVNFPRWDAKPGWQDSAGWRAHDHFFTYAELVGRPECRLPSLGVDWRPTRPPVVLDLWSPEPPGTTWTTVLTWDNFRRPIEHEGRVYGTKEVEFPKVETLPGLVPAKLELAVGGSAPPVERWRSLGWNVISSEAVSVTPASYREYVQRSRGEFSVAKNVYAATRSGWFSCRSVCYLAAGRPCVLQDTGFSELLPTGEGLLAYDDLRSAAVGIAAVEDDYAGHAAAASAIAAEHFAGEVVLGGLLSSVGL